ncbi:RHS repeat-associated core domain-containing protein [Clostridium taeniosporum]|uniref:RHS repeat-associated core domain-containing protein n=1 Tax=Clostridium taeniosporum TaxID=394958 RepID=UPI0013149440|nr:RHS repeat-associated core domain-containing protein [Clostridium taeniosporum]
MVRIRYNIYSASGQLVSMSITSSTTPDINGEYYYIRNAQGDIIGLFDGTGTQIASYSYDSWGKLISIKDGSGVDITNDTESIGYKNPYRYRGYRYDTETGLYYLQSRYYNPEFGRFINADTAVGQIGNIQGHNMFQYCFNNPVNMDDPSGQWPAWLDYIGDVVEDTVNTVINTVKSVVDNVTAYVSNVISSAVNMVKASLGASGEPNSVGREYNKNGNLTKERWYGPDGRASKDKHYTDHGNPKRHSKVPHEHDWGYNKNGKWATGPWYSDIGTKAKVSIGVAGGTYLIYRGLRMIPSFAPPLWWTIPANIVTP